MKFKRALIIILAILFFLSALTSYINRVLFPQLFKKVALEHIQEALKRKVEIESIHFNWLKGFIIDKIKIYEANQTDVFAQANQVSFGIIFFPGLNHSRVTIPFINVQSPQVHLVHLNENSWNFSDMFFSSQTTAKTSTSWTDAGIPKPSSFEIAWGGLTIHDGQFQVDDQSDAHHPWSEYFNNINLKLSLSYKGINYDFSTDIPHHNGYVSATVYYEPLTQNTQAHVYLKNIDCAQYLTLIHFPNVTLNSAILNGIDLNINYTKGKTTASGNVVLKSLDIETQDQTFKGDVEIHNLNAQYAQGAIKTSGQISLINLKTTLDDLSASGTIQAKVADFQFDHQQVSFAGSLHADGISMTYKTKQIQADGADFNNVVIKKNTDGISATGSVNTQGLLFLGLNQKFSGNFNLKNMSLQMKDINDMVVQGDLQATNFQNLSDHQNITSQQFFLDDAQLEIKDQKNISLNTKLSADATNLNIGKNLSVQGSFKTDQLLLDLNDDILKVTSTLDFSEGKFIIDRNKTINAAPQIELNVQVPLKAPDEYTYKGSLTLSGGTMSGWGALAQLNNVQLDADFQNDAATINALNINVLDTDVAISGSILNFKKPMVDITAEANELNLAKLNQLLPQLTAPLGLSFDGMAHVKLRFAGLASNPLAGNINARISVKKAGVYSSSLHQQINNVTGVFEASPDDLQWHNISALYLGKKYTLSGSLENFKAPMIQIFVDSQDLHFKADLTKINNLLRVNSLSGKYLSATFEDHGNITMIPHHPIHLFLTNDTTFLLEDLLHQLPAAQQKNLSFLNPTGLINVSSQIKGLGVDWKKYDVNATISSPSIHLMGYSLTDLKIQLNQANGGIKKFLVDGLFYEGAVHALGSIDWKAKGMPYDLALNIQNTDLHKLKNDSPLKMQEINGKFFLTVMASGTIDHFKDNLQAKGTLNIKDGFLGEFNLFKGLLSTLNDALHLGQIMITDVDDNFTIAHQKLNTEDLRLKGPTLVLLGKGWVDFDQNCDLNMTVDLSSGVVPAIANDVLSTLSIRIYDKISNPKFKKRISVPEVINSLFKNFLQ